MASKGSKGGDTGGKNKDNQTREERDQQGKSFLQSLSKDVGGKASPDPNKGSKNK